MDKNLRAIHLALFDKIQSKIIEEIGGMDQTVFRQRIKEIGLLAEWNANLTPEERKLQVEAAKAMSKHQ